jgi:hypothetical protein
MKVFFFSHFLSKKTVFSQVLCNLVTLIDHYLPRLIQCTRLKLKILSFCLVCTLFLSNKEHNFFFISTVCLVQSYWKRRKKTHPIDCKVLNKLLIRFRFCFLNDSKLFELDYTYEKKKDWVIPGNRMTTLSQLISASGSYYPGNGGWHFHDWLTTTDEW